MLFLWLMSFVYTIASECSICIATGKKNSKMNVATDINMAVHYLPISFIFNMQFSLTCLSYVFA